MVRNIEYKFDSYKESQGRNAGSSPVPTTFKCLGGALNNASADHHGL